MTAVFTDFFRAQLFANQALLNTATVQVVYFSQAPALDENDPRVASIQTVSDLTGKLGWGPSLTPSVSQTVGTTTSSGSVFVMANNPFFNQAGWNEVVVRAAAFVYVGTLGAETNPVMFITSTPFNRTVIGPDDSLVALPNTVLGGSRAIFSWPVPPVGAPTVLPVERSMIVYKAPPPFEPSHLQHVWLFPQRVNLIANPSFEWGGNHHWRTSGSLTRVNTGAPGGGSWHGQFTGTAPVVAESNTFPLTIASDVGGRWTVQALVRGNGKLKVGIVAWEPDFLHTSVDWGTEEWDLSPTAYTRVWALRTTGEGTVGQVRLECNGTLMGLDNVLCEPDFLKDWPYFDGDSIYGARDDFTWYGGENRKTAGTYSLWYNHRNDVIGRTFAWSIPEDDFVVTDAEVQEQGFVYKWVPAGVRVTPHIDVLYEGDIQAAVPDVVGTPVNPYKVNAADQLGVDNPWTTSDD